MNKKIQKMIDQSNDYAFAWCEQHDENGDMGKWHDIFRQKFAELILRDAADFVDQNTNDNGYGVADDWTTGKELLAHYGIK